MKLIFLCGVEACSFEMPQPRIDEIPIQLAAETVSSILLNLFYR